VGTYILMGHKNNNDNTTTPIFIGLNETTQKTCILIRECENAITLEYFNLKTNTE
jgi:hypothetical protein